MNTAIKRNGGQPDQFVLATESGLQWAKSNRKTAMIWSGAALLLILVLAGGFSLYQHRLNEARTAFGEAMQVYQTPVARQDQPLPPGIKSFPSAKERAQKANGMFVSVAERFSMMEPGKLAQYFAGVTSLEAGDTARAEQQLKTASSSWNGDIAALAKLSLAQIYGQTGQQAQAVDLYQQLASGHATTVPPAMARIELADLYSSEGKTEQARQIYADVKDHDKDPKGKPGVAAQIAAQKLNPQAAPGAGPGAGPR